MIHYDVSTAIYNQEEAAALAQTAKRLQKKAKIHIKIDTGMSRLGLMPDEMGLTAAKAILSLTDIVVEGIFSHFSKADEKDKSYAQKSRKNDSTRQAGTYFRAILQSGCSTFFSDWWRGTGTCYCKGNCGVAWRNNYSSKCK